MMNSKEFDCIVAKREAQEAILENIKGMSPKEEIDYFRKAASEGPLGDWWRKIGEEQANPNIQRPATA
ncbi:MAG: hypothetical protein HY961_12070 [Ignavibacteriae bacterium]|nr:hypothetical protein [Ignavibacteriota bacterium]